MKFIFIIIFTVIIISDAKIVIDVTTGRNLSDIIISYSGYDKQIIADDEIGLFNINKFNLKQAVKNHYNTLPRDVYLKSPTPWGDLYKIYNWEPVSRILKVKSAKVKQNSSKSVLILAQDFGNESDKTIKVNAGISQSVENTIVTSWSTSKEITVAQEIEYDLNVIFAKLSGTTSFSYTSSWGKTEERSESVTVGSTTGVEIELKPRQSATAVLSANRCILEIEVEYMKTLRGNVAVNFRKEYKGHHFYGPSITSVLASGGLATEKTVVENIKIGVYTEACLKVTDKESGLPL